MSTFPASTQPISLAIGQCENRLVASSATHWLWYERGKLLVEQGHYEAALSSFDTVLSMQPNEHRAWVFRGVVLAHLTYYESALDSFSKAIEIVADDRQVWIFRGAILSYLGRQSEAYTSYAIALKMQQQPSRYEESYPMWVPPTVEWQIGYCV